MRHVFVETNWVVSYAAPAHHKLQVPAAEELLDRAANNEILLHLPSICVSEARRPIQERFKVRTEADRIRQFLLWAKDEEHITEEETEITRRVLDKMEGFVKHDLGRLETTLAGLKGKPGLEIFDLTQIMAQRCTDLSFQKLGIQAFDQMILAAILVRSEELSKSGEEDIVFCEIDADLQPWNSDRELKQPLATLYDNARVWVYGDFLMQAPAKREGWPGQPAQAPKT